MVSNIDKKDEIRNQANSYYDRNQKKAMPKRGESSNDRATGFGIYQHLQQYTSEYARINCGVWMLCQVV